MQRPVCAACEGEMKLGSGTSILVSLIIVAAGLVLTPVLIGIPIVIYGLGYTDKKEYSCMLCGGTHIEWVQDIPQMLESRLTGETATRKRNLIMLGVVVGLMLLPLLRHVRPDSPLGFILIAAAVGTTGFRAYQIVNSRHSCSV